jgi:hypothetical protein
LYMQDCGILGDFMDHDKIASIVLCTNGTGIL